MKTTQPAGYLAQPPTGSGQPVLVLHAWWGLNNTIKAFCNQLAEAGCVAFAPDLYRGKLTDQIDEAEKLARALDETSEQVQADIAQAVEFVLAEAGHAETGLAVIGFSLGAAYALDLSANDPENVHKVVVFYGVGPADFSNARAAYLGHFAENDPYEPQESVEWLTDEISQAGRPFTVHVYPNTGHWFAEPDRTDAYNAAAADLAWERTLAFLN